MLEGLANRWKAEARGAVRLAALAAASIAAAGIALAFFCAAAFVFVLDRYGLTDACLAGAAVFLAVTIILLIVYALVVARRRRMVEEARARAAKDAATPSLLSDPRLILAAFQVIQAVGLKRMLPLLAVGGAAFALAASARRRTGPDSQTGP